MHMADQCRLCQRHREPSSEFCGLHGAALRNLNSAYSSWNKAYGGKLSSEEFLAKVAILPETGRSVREVIQHLRGKGVVS
jgi:hypothetical protein